MAPGHDVFCPLFSVQYILILFSRLPSTTSDSGTGASARWARPPSSTAEAVMARMPETVFLQEFGKVAVADAKPVVFEDLMSGIPVSRFQGR
jgi:hypothetical protein